MTLQNTQGQRFFGIHFYPGVAEYRDPKIGAYRVFLNENTLRKMDSTFEGKPVFVDHVDGVESSIDKLRSEADGWVVRSFYNEKDGKHWVEFLMVSERGMEAVRKGMRLSNAYLPTEDGEGGMWNGVTYEKEISNGVYEHLAIVDNPRYEESIILTPEEFKKYNAEKEIELKRLANSKEQKGEQEMGLNFFKRSKVENAVDLESTMVTLPKSKKEFTIVEIVNQLDAILNMHGYANPDHMVKVGENEMSVKEMIKDYMGKCNEIEEMKKANEAKDEEEHKNDAEDGDMDAADEKAENSEDAEKEEEKKEEAKKNALEVAAKNKAIMNAGTPSKKESATTIDLPQDRLARGRELF